MSKKLLLGIGGIFLSVAMTGGAIAQNLAATTITKTVPNADAAYSVIQYPVGKEVVVDLTPGADLSGAKGIAHIMCSGDQTMVNLDLSGLPTATSSYFVYAVNPTGAVTLLGPAGIVNGMSKVSFTTSMNKFMLVLSPTEGLDTIGNDTVVVFRSAIPQGYAVVNNTNTSGKKQTATTDIVSSTYDVPLLGVPSFSGKTTEIKINFSGDLQGLKGKAYVKLENGTAQVKMLFDDMQMAPKDKRFILWAVSSDKQYTKLGQVINTGDRQEGEIRSETALKDFGLFVTVEDADVAQPGSTVYSPLKIGN